MKPSSDSLLEAVSQSGAHDAADLLEQASGEDAAKVLQQLNPLVAQQVLGEMQDEQRTAAMTFVPLRKARQWASNREHPEDSVGWLMEEPVAVFRPDATARDTIEDVRKLAKKAFITYGYITDEEGHLLGLLVMRDLMLAKPDARLAEVMLKDPFKLDPDMELTEAMKMVVNKHYPVYPVCSKDGILLGLVRGQTLFEARAIEISAQVGSMVGVEKEERLSTPLLRSLRFRHPWLQINLVTCFIAATVVGVFEGTLGRLVILAAFLPVLAGQSGNTGCQALAVTLRGMTLGDLKPGDERRLVIKEGLLGLYNGMLVGISAGVGMGIYARMNHNPNALMLAFVVWVAMTFSCVVSGLSGALIPLLLRKFGADPATASSIFLTTATDVISMGTFLGLATLLVP
ncbi:magnesium transporter [Prosthecobacter sp.]|uniref:magnesium transporter n=1 Tax=Prosthecobacter sp. TaxID=1965333 RepID=UPI0024899312|nr:magnesium transporter [Prosthecobacter sp.]MDI1315236.1 magnesium transporter [Prosthecobacter sp.]